ncbi:MAG TPA: S-methyl-5-thioribose-1-phosphate isomerase, partial [Deltaproteobacteria bacterium]|nr:S-methyl-5-thioribose-1-phosphate isomerase [Deltaproteobacteria bacterium]
MIRPFYYDNGTFFILDQRLLPNEQRWMACTSAEQVADAIKTLAVRGAPAIGIAAAYGLAMAAALGNNGLEEAAGLLISARPTAVNLEWAVRRVLAAADGQDDLIRTVLFEAKKIWE